MLQWLREHFVHVQEGARLPGFGEQFNGMSRWRLPGSGPPGPSSKDVYIGVESLWR